MLKLVIACLIGISCFGAPKEMPFSLVFLNQKFTLSSPIIQDQDTTYIYLKDVDNLLHSKSRFSRKNNHFKLQLKTKTRLILSAYSTTFYINTLANQFSKPPIFYKNKFYIPIRDFFIALGYETQFSDTTITITKPTLLSSNTITKQTTYTAAVATQKVNTPLKSHTVPLFETGRNVRIQYRNESENISNLFIVTNNQNFVAIDPFLARVGYSISQTNTQYLYTLGPFKVALPKTNRQATVTSEGQKHIHLIHAKPIDHNGQTYLPLDSLEKLFLYRLDWDPKRRVIHLLSPITKLTFYQKNGDDHIRVHSPHPLPHPVITRLIKKTGTEFEFDHTIPMIGDKYLDIHKDIFKFATYKKWKHNTQITVITDFKAGATSTLQEDGSLLTFYPVIHNIIQRALYNNNAEIQLKSTGIMDYTHSFSQNPPKLIITFKDTDISLPETIVSHSHFYEQIRSYRIQKDAISSRVVIDLADTSKPELTYDQTKHTLKLRFKGKKDALPVAIAPMSLKPKKSIPKRVSRRKKTIKNVRIALDAGHGGGDPGAVRRGVKEKNYTLDITKRLTKKLNAAGATVIQARKFDENPSLGARTRIANNSNVDMFISIHVNSFFKSYANGTETYYYKWKDKKLAQHLQKAMVKHLKRRDNGVKRGKLYVLHHSKMPAALIEPSFMTNPKEAKLLKNPSYRQKITDAIFEGIVSYLK